MLQGPGDDNKKLPFILLEPHRKKKKRKEVGLKKYSKINNTDNVEKFSKDINQYFQEDK